MNAEKIYAGSHEHDDEGTFTSGHPIESLHLAPSPERMEQLEPEQVAAAEIAGFRFLLSRSKKDARRELPHLRAKAGKQRLDEELISDHVSQLLATMVSLQNEPDRRDRDVDYEGKAKEILAAYEDGKDKIFDKAASWNTRDFKRMIRGAVRESQDLEDNLIYERHTSITPENVESAKKTLVRERIVTGATTLASEGFSHGAGLVVTALSLEESLPDNSTPALIGIATVTYGVLAYILIRNGFVNAKLLEKTGISTDPMSKSAFENATENEKKAAFWGYVKWHSLWEVPFYGVAAYVGIKYGADAGLINFITANMAGTGKNMVVNGATRLGLGISDVVRRRKENKNDNSINGGMRLA